MALTKKDAYKKIYFYTSEITKKKPTFDTVFRVYYDSLCLIKKAMYHIEENPWHPNNDHSDEIFESLNECFNDLDKKISTANN